MRDGEGFLARWSRLKRAQGTAAAGKDVAPAPEGVSEPIEEHAPEPAPPVDALPGPVDLASLPPIESIGPGSDISGYLTAGVPPELMQAALRSAWRTDPVIREFVEMADNQWDFNTPEAIPGFGALGITEEAKGLVARAATGTVEQTAAMLASVQSSGDRRSESHAMSGVALEDSRVVDPVWHAGVIPLAEVEQASNWAPARHLEPDTPPPNRRLHGSALPKSE
jgi:hypothetical protein